MCGKVRSNFVGTEFLVCDSGMHAPFGPGRKGGILTNVMASSWLILYHLLPLSFHNKAWRWC